VSLQNLVKCQYLKSNKRKRLL